MATRVDHLVMAVSDLAAATQRLQDRWGLTVVGSGEHHELGTANVLLSFGSAYLELLVTVDPDSVHPVAVQTRAAAAQGDTLVGLVLQVEDVASAAARLGTQVIPMRRSGSLPGSWHLTGVERALAGRWPAFIQWEHGRPATSGVEPLGTIELQGDRAALQEWVGEDVPGLALLQGEADLRVLMADGQPLV